MGSIENIKSAIVNFEKAKKLTEEQNDVKAGNAIKKALEDCKKKLKKLEEEQEEKQAQEEDLPIEEKSKTPEITAREKKSEEPESIVKTEPQTPTEPVKQMIPSDSDQPIRKETPIEIVSTTKTDEAKSSQKQQVESKPEPI